MLDDMRPTRSQLLVPRQTFDRRVVGTPEHVRDTIRLLKASRRLVHVSPWTEHPEGYQVTVRLLDRPPQPAAPQRRRRWPLIAAGCATGVTVLGVAAYAVIQLVNAVIENIAVIGGALLLLALVAVLARGRGSRTFSGTFTGRLD